METTKGNQARLALENSNDRLSGDCREGGSLDPGLRCSDDLNPVLEGWMCREGDQVVVNAHKGENLLGDKL